MADSDLQALHTKLTEALTERVKVFSDEQARDQDFIDLLGAVAAAKEVATQILELDRRSATLHLGTDAPSAPELQSRLDGMASTRTRLVDALVTLTRELER